MANSCRHRYVLSSHGGGNDEAPCQLAEDHQRVHRFRDKVTGEVIEWKSGNLNEVIR